MKNQEQCYSMYDKKKCDRKADDCDVKKYLKKIKRKVK